MQEQNLPYIKLGMQLVLSNLLNENKIFKKFSDLSGVELNNDSEIFEEIEEFIVNKFIEMHKTKNKNI